MAPMVEAFPPWQLPTRIQHRASDGKLRKDGIGAGGLEKCKLMELVQYDCELRGPVQNPRSVVVCEPVVRLFRKCANGMVVETTAWEGVFNSKGEREG